MAGSRSQRHMIRIQGIRADGRRFTPNRLTIPTISGTKTNGSTLTGVEATFQTSATHPVTRTRRWLRNGVPISGATGLTYVLQAADVGKVIQFQSIGTSSRGATYVNSLPTVPIT